MKSNSSAFDHFDVAVIGGGASGCMAYLRCVLNYDRTAIFLGDAPTKKRARGTWVSEVENIPGFHNQRKPLTNLTQSTVDWIAQHSDLKHRGLALPHSVSRITLANSHFEIEFTDTTSVKQIITTSYVILCTGIMDIQPTIDGSIRPFLPFANRMDILYCLRCDGHRVIGHNLSVIGHTDSTLNVGIVIKERYNSPQINILTNGMTPAFSQETLAMAHQYHFQIYDQPITSIIGNPREQGLQGFQLQGGTEISSTKCLIALGFKTYTELVDHFNPTKDGRGLLIVDKTGQTSVPNLFAAGDVVAGKKFQIYTAWDEAVDVADEINKRLRKKRRPLSK